MEVEHIYFLIPIGICIALLVALAFRLEKKHQKEVKARKAKARLKALRLHRRAPVRRQANDGDMESLPAHELIARGSLAKRAAKPPDGSSFAASGVFSDDGEAKDESADAEPSRKFRSWS